MEQVAAALADLDFEAALVRLWVLASDTQRLVEWEHQYYQNDTDDPNRNPALIQGFRHQIEAGNRLQVAEMNHNALALVLAVDALLAYSRLASRMLRRCQVDGNHYWLIRQLVNWRAQTALRGQRGSLLTWFVQHTIIPGQVDDKKMDVMLYQCDGATAEFFMALLESPEAHIKIWIGHFADGADVQWDKPHPISESCRTVAVVDGKTRLASLHHQLARASQEGAHFVVFPEFSLDHDQRKAVKIWLKNNNLASLRYVVPGSFHTQVDDSASGQTFNTAPLLNAAGKVVFTHQKLRLFGKGKVAENVSVGKTLHVLATPVGCLTVLICKDFMDVDAHVANLLQHVLVDWVLVPSFGDARTIRGHKARAKQLATIVSGTNSAVANSRNTALEPKARVLPGFGHRSGQEQPTPVLKTGGMVEYLLPNGPEAIGDQKKMPKKRHH